MRQIKDSQYSVVATDSHIGIKKDLWKCSFFGNVAGYMPANLLKGSCFCLCQQLPKKQKK